MGSPKQPFLDYAPPAKKVRRQLRGCTIWSILTVELFYLLWGFLVSPGLWNAGTWFNHNCSSTVAAISSLLIFSAPGLIGLACAVLALRPFPKSLETTDGVVAVFGIIINSWWLVSVFRGIHALYHIYLHWL